MVVYSYEERRKPNQCKVRQPLQFAVGRKADDSISKLLPKSMSKKCRYVENINKYLADYDKTSGVINVELG